VEPPITSTISIKPRPLEAILLRLQGLKRRGIAQEKSVEAMNALRIEAAKS
jgi:hypothetical protein